MFRDSSEWNLFVLGVGYALLSAVVLMSLRGSVFTSGDSIAHTYIAGSIFNNGAHSKVANLGTVWLPLFHLLLAPLTLIKPLYSVGLAGTIVNGIATGGILVYLSRIVRSVTPRRDIRYGAILLFLASGLTAIYAATPMTEQTSIFFALGGTYYFHRYWTEESMPDFVFASIFIALATLVRYEFWFVAVAVVLMMVVNEVRNRRVHNLAFFHLPLWGGFLWIVWNAGLFGDPFYFIASKTMPVSVSLISPMPARIAFLGLLLLVGGATFLLPFLLERKHYNLGLIPGVVFGLYLAAYLLGFHGLLTNFRYGYVLFGLLIPSVVALRRFDTRYTAVALVFLMVSAVLSSGLLLSGVYAGVLGVEGVQETSAEQAEHPPGKILLPIKFNDDLVRLDMDYYPANYLGPYDGHAWIAASEAPWNSPADYVIIPPVSEARLDAYRTSGPNEGMVWNYHTNESWRERFDREFRLVDADIGLYERTSGSVNSTHANDSTDVR